MLAARLLPTATYLRNRDSLKYTPEPDIFHDVFGHAPMHAHKAFSGYVQRYGRSAPGQQARKRSNGLAAYLEARRAALSYPWATPRESGLPCENEP